MDWTVCLPLLSRIGEVSVAVGHWAFSGHILVRSMCGGHDEVLGHRMVKFGSR